ncbi:hypothetical protein ACTFIY_011971 [Dictyostelium cf. discoideum]
MNKLEFKIIYKDRKYLFDEKFPNQLNGVITPQEYSVIINGLHSRLKITSVIDLALIIYCIVFVAYNSNKYRRFIKLLNEQFQSRSISFSSPRILFKFRIHYPKLAVEDIIDNNNININNNNIISSINNENSSEISEISPLLNNSENT